MRALGVIGIILLLAALIYLFQIILREGQTISGWWRQRKVRHAPWMVEAITQPDESIDVVLRKPGMKARTVKELPRGMDPIDFRSELQIALEDAEEQARVLNRGK